MCKFLTWAILVTSFPWVAVAMVLGKRVTISVDELGLDKKFSVHVEDGAYLL